MAQTPEEMNPAVHYFRRHERTLQKYAFAALRDKRAEIAGRIVSLKKRIARHKIELAKLDGVIRLFDPSYQVGFVPARRAKQQSNLFKQVSWAG
jgi:hypothetical protein